MTWKAFRESLIPQSWPRTEAEGCWLPKVAAEAFYKKGLLRYGESAVFDE